MPLNISKFTQTKNIFYTDVFLKGDFKVKYDFKGLIVAVFSLDVLFAVDFYYYIIIISSVLLHTGLAFAQFLPSRYCLFL